MCITPNFVHVQRGEKWEQQEVACRQCWQCKSHRLNDYVGRCMAEASVSAATATVSLTYAPRDDLADKILNPRHFQLFMKSLRKAGHKVRYLVAGEYGEIKGRAHFHALLFFTKVAAKQQIASYGNPAPFSAQIPQKKMVHISEWPHGHVLVDWATDERAIRYVCKYILADDKNRAWFSLSKRPALGHAWFQEKAAQVRGLDVLPSSFQYMPPGGTRSVQYQMSGATRRDYLNAITTDPALLPRMNEWVQKTFEKHHRARVLAALNSQPAEVLEAAFIEGRARVEEQNRLMRLFRELAEVDHLDDMLASSSDGVLRRHNGKWQPTKGTTDGS